MMIALLRTANNKRACRFAVHQNKKIKKGESMYIPAESVLLIATQKSCKGLGSWAEARVKAKAKLATVTR